MNQCQLSWCRDFKIIDTAIHAFILYIITVHPMKWWLSTRALGWSPTVYSLVVTFRPRWLDGHNHIFVRGEEAAISVLITHDVMFHKVYRGSKKLWIVGRKMEQIWCIVGQKKPKFAPFSFPQCSIFWISDKPYCFNYRVRVYTMWLTRLSLANTVKLTLCGL